ncbi:hypothetical protein AAVH_06838 [Aphelenchoides avenae]|nr:hypothetical protein AAVH_06838 [Aphelenchus avenae]
MVKVPRFSQKELRTALQGKPVRQGKKEGRPVRPGKKDANFRYHAERIIGDEDDDEDVYEVELITDKRVCEKFPRCKLCKKDGEGKAMFVYYIHWKGYSTGTWEHLTDMKNAILAYEAYWLYQEGATRDELEALKQRVADLEATEGPERAKEVANEIGEQMCAVAKRIAEEDGYRWDTYDAEVVEPPMPDPEPGDLVVKFPRAKGDDGETIQPLVLQAQTVAALETLRKVFKHSGRHVGELPLLMHGYGRFCKNRVCKGTWKSLYNRVKKALYDRWDGVEERADGDGRQQQEPIGGGDHQEEELVGGGADNQQEKPAGGGDHQQEELAGGGADHQEEELFGGGDHQEEELAGGGADHQEEELVGGDEQHTNGNEGFEETYRPSIKQLIEAESDPEDESQRPTVDVVIDESFSDVMSPPPKRGKVFYDLDAGATTGECEPLSDDDEGEPCVKVPLCSSPPAPTWDFFFNVLNAPQ